MARRAARTCSSPARSSPGSPCVAPRGRATGGQPRPTGPTLSPRARSLGSNGRPAVPKARARPCGGRLSIARASRRPASASAARMAAPGRPGRGARGPRRPGVPCLCRRRRAVQRSRRPGPGRRGRTGGSVINGARGAKGRSRKGCGPAACGAPVSGAWRNPTGSISRPPPPSRSIGWWPGGRSVHGRRRAPRASPRSLPPVPYPQGHHRRSLPLPCLVL
jgi:hypothetical protein